VFIDVEPGSDRNEIELGDDDPVRVAVLTNTAFDAAQVNQASVHFAGAKGKEPKLRDVDHDGDKDLLLKFDGKQLKLQAGDTVGCLSATIIDGRGLSACDEIRVVEDDDD
jgi:hypothetical protein